MREVGWHRAVCGNNVPFFHLSSPSGGRTTEDQGGIKKEGQIKKVVTGGEGGRNVRVGGGEGRKWDRHRGRGGRGGR